MPVTRMLTNPSTAESTSESTSAKTIPVAKLQPQTVIAMFVM